MYELYLIKTVFVILVDTDNQDETMVKGENYLEYFKKITTDIYPEGPTNVILMGYNTWISLPTVLPNRINVILCSWKILYINSKIFDRLIHHTLN